MQARIPTRSRQQALDWSLVLASQGIETLIDEQPEAGFGLCVSPEDLPRAREAILQFRRENRRFVWKPQDLPAGLVFDWSSLAWAFLVLVFYLLSNQLDLKSAGMMSQTRVLGGEAWRLFTAVWLHGDSGHLASNVSLGVILLALVMGHYGPGIGLLSAYLAGVGGNLTILALGSPGHQSLGASGLVMGCVGLLASSPALFKAGWVKRPGLIVSGIATGAMIFALLGLAPHTDVLAHFGGFISGILLGLLLALFPEHLQEQKWHWLSGLLLTLIVAGSWIAALA